jgi:hypothetical protein
MGARRIRAILDVNRTEYPAVIVRGQTMHDKMDADTATYAAPSPLLPAFLTLIQSAAACQQAVSARASGTTAARDVAIGLLITAMESERMYVQSLADASPSRAVLIIENAGLVVAGVPLHPKAILSLSTTGQPSGCVACEANVALLVGAGSKMPTQSRFYNWEYTVDGAKTFIAAPPTSRARTVLQNLTPLTMVGVRVNLNNSDGPGPWSQVVSILVR